MKQTHRFLYRLGLGGLALAFCLAVFAADPGGTAVTVRSPAPLTVAPDDGTAALSFGLDRIPELQDRFLEIPLWQYAATAIYAALALLAARLLDYLVAVQLRKLASQTKTELDDLLIDLLRGPVKLLAFVMLLSFGFNLFPWPGWLERWVHTGFKILIALSLSYMGLKFVDVLASYWRARLARRTDSAFNELLIPLVSKSAKAFLLIMAVLVTLDNLNFNVRTLLAGASISGLALGLAAQDTVGNLFGAAAVFVDKPFRIGDHIKLTDVEGVVEEMGLRSTRVRNPDGHLITVPNKTMGTATITNITRRPRIKTVLNIGLTYDLPAGKVREAIDILRDTYGGHPGTHDLILGFNQFADSALNINVIHWWKDADTRSCVAGMQELNLEIKQRFDDAKIAFAFPSRTVYVRQDSDWQLHTAGLAPGGNGQRV